ncbi:hypothetical protein [Allopusillimonas ginsengisoli]|uniref:hypothetical protein n=1 Tax=Allopusillimonas ginsengisoli TaxID=453575 RepID=UPI0010221BC6|nr:hypothetical protein [Allopusillimonas ginsengisoli]TEA71880.1 hypothetical protein ERE07_20280 [Allopusillimonas ginsengisoli]
MRDSNGEEHDQSKLISAMVVAAPAVFVYFLGWAYLNYYLGAFGISVAELDLGIETIFIYAAPAAIWLLKTQWSWIVGIAVLVWGLALWRRHSGVRTKELSSSGRRLLSSTWYVQIVAVFVGSTLLVMFISPFVKEAALDSAAQRWDRSGINIRALVDSPGFGSVERQDYETCMKRDGLRLVFGDKNSYYMLCAGEIDNTEGLIYEVRGHDSVLASVRGASRPH